MLTCDCGRFIDGQFASGDRLFSHRYYRAWRQEIPLISDRQLRTTIDGLRRLERKCFASRSRFAFYRYLRDVFELYVQLRRSKQATKASRQIAKMFGLRKQKRTHPIRMILDATSTADFKTRSRWTRALKYAWHERKTWTNLKLFLRENGGPAGCAKQFAAVTKKDQPYIIYRRPGNGYPYLMTHRGCANASSRVASTAAQRGLPVASGDVKEP